MITILVDTPLWVWGVLALLVNRGIAAMTTTQLAIRQLVLLPLAFTAWSRYAITRQFGTDASAYVGLATTAVAMGCVFWSQFRQSGRIILDRTSMTITRPGTPYVLLLSLAGFAVRYALGVLVALDPALLAHATFASFYGAMSGLVTGAMWGMVLGQIEAGWRMTSRPGLFFIRMGAPTRRSWL